MIADGGSGGGTGGSLAKEGSYILTLSGSNTYSGSTTVNAGGLQLGDSSHTGKILNAVTVGSGATFDLVNADTSGITAVTNSGSTIFHNSASAASIAITNNASAGLNFNDASTAASATITNNSSGSVSFSGTSTKVNSSPYGYSGLPPLGHQARAACRCRH